MPSEEPAPEVARLASSIESLADQVEVLRNAIDDCRDELTWAVQNGKTVLIAVPCQQCSTVRSMASDPTSERWAEHLEIRRSGGEATERTDISRLTQTVESLTDNIAAVELGIRWLHKQIDVPVPETINEPPAHDSTQSTPDSWPDGRLF